MEKPDFGYFYYCKPCECISFKFYGCNCTLCNSSMCDNCENLHEWAIKQITENRVDKENLIGYK